MKLEPNVTYFVESDADDTVLIAMDAKVRNGGVEWFDSSRDRAFKAVKVEETSDAFRFETATAKYALRKLTIELYNKRVAGKVDGHPAFLDTESVQRFYAKFPR